jgi:hypothetical protein
LIKLPRHDQPLSPLPAIQQKKILLLLLLAIQRRALKIDHCIDDAIIFALDFIPGALCLLDCHSLPCNAIWKFRLVAWHDLSLPCRNQPLSSLLLVIQHKNTLFAVIIVIDSMIFILFLCGTYYVIPLQFPLHLVMVNLLPSLAPSQYDVKNVVVIASCNINDDIVAASCNRT